MKSKYSHSSQKSALSSQKLNAEATSAAYVAFSMHLFVGIAGLPYKYRLRFTLRPCTLATISYSTAYHKLFFQDMEKAATYGRIGNLWQAAANYDLPTMISEILIHFG